MKHNNYKKPGICVLYLLAALPLQHAIAQSKKDLSLTEAIQLSLKTSGQLKIANAKVDEATAVYHEAKNNHLPDVKVTGAYMRLNNPDVNLKVKLGGGGDSTKPGSSSSIKVDQAAYGIVNASLPLFSGFRIKYGIESAKYLEQAAKLDAGNNKEEVIQNTINAYSNLYKAKKSVDLVKENLEQQKQRVTDFSNLERNGLLARNDLLKAQLQQSNIELSLLDAENNYNITCVNMALMLGLPEGTELIPDTSGFQPPADAGSLVQWEQRAFQNRKDLSSLSYREKAATSNIKSIKGEYYPGIALTGGYIAADIPNLLTITNALNVGIGLQYNLGALWKTGAKVAEAKARLHEVMATEGILSDQVRLEINQAYQNYLLSTKKIDVYAKAIEQSNENYRITKNKYDNNLVTTTDLLEADVAQLQAQLNYTFSKADALVAYKKLQQTAGTLSENYNLTSNH
jgi:outer membrane protein